MHLVHGGETDPTAEERRADQMTYVNGVTSHEPSPPAALTPDGGENN